MSFFPAKQVADRLSKTTKSISVDEEFIENFLYTPKENRYAFGILALFFPHLDYKNNDFYLDHCHPISVFNGKKLKVAGIINEANLEYFTNWYYFNSIINLLMLDGNENKSKNASDLKSWVKKFNPSLKKHSLPNELELRDFPDFVKERSKLLKSKLYEVLSFN